MKDAWSDILSKVQNKEMSVEEAASRIAALEEGETPPESPVAAPVMDEEIRPDIGWVRYAWLAIFLVGVVIFILGAVLMAWAQSGGHPFWFCFSWLPFALGLFVLFLGWWSQRARWLHVRVQEKGGHQVAISMPLPLRFASWVLRVFGPWIPQLKEKNLDVLPLALDGLSHAEGPLTVEVDDDNSRVRVYIL